MSLNATLDIVNLFWTLDSCIRCPPVSVEDKVDKLFNPFTRRCFSDFTGLCRGWVSVPPHEEYWFLTSNSPLGGFYINTPDVWKRLDLCKGLWCSDDQSLGGGLIDPNLGSHPWSRQEKVMEVFVPLVIKPALVNPYVPFLWTLEDHWSHCSASALFASQLSRQTSHIHKQASQTTVKKKKKHSSINSTNDNYPLSVEHLSWPSFMPSYLTYEITV